jgi:hypothetical protein
MNTCPLCAEEKNVREAVQDYDGVALCTYHALAAQTNEEGIRDRIAAHKAPERPARLLASIEVRGVVHWIADDVTPPVGQVVVRGPIDNQFVYVDGVCLGQSLRVDPYDFDHYFVADGPAPCQTIINRTRVEFILDVDALRPRSA